MILCPLRRILRPARNWSMFTMQDHADLMIKENAKRTMSTFVNVCPKAQVWIHSPRKMSTLFQTWSTIILAESLTTTRLMNWHYSSWTKKCSSWTDSSTSPKTWLIYTLSSTKQMITQHSLFCLSNRTFHEELQKFFMNGRAFLRFHFALYFHYICHFCSA